MTKSSIRALAAAWVVLIAGAAAPAADVKLPQYRIVESLLVRFDADGDSALDAAERKKLQQHVSERFGEQGTEILDLVLAAGDVDRDGRITKAEWQALGKRVAAAAGKRTAAGRNLSVMVPMSDGVRLATDVYLPEGEGPWPAVLSRTPYNKRRAAARGFTRQGYAVVAQDMRGRFASEGENLPFIGCGWVDHQDGADTIAWIRRQAWCNGKVATTGGSALGITQNLLAPTAPKGLLAQYIVVAAASMYHHAAYVGGALRKSQVEGWLRGNRFDANATKMFVEHPAYDEFWRGFDAVRECARITAPAMHVGGWFDTFSAGTVAAFVSRQHRGGKGARGRQKLVMGPWAHGISLFGKVGELRFPKAGAPAKYNAASWFAWHLKGEESGAKDLPAVAYYVMGDTSDRRAPGNEWRFADDWPVPHVPTAYYFHADGKLSTARPPGAAGSTPQRRYTFDPADPCPTVGGCNLNLPKGPRNQNRIEGRKDVLTFTTEPLAGPVEVTGHPTARVHLASSAVDTDLSVRFCDVYPDGKSYLMAEGMLRVRYRDGFEKPTPLPPGKAVEVEVELWPTSIVINRGHRIRVAVTSSNYPRFDVNPGTGKPYARGDRTVKQTNTIYCGGRRESRIILPVVVPKK